MKRKMAIVLAALMTFMLCTSPVLAASSNECLSLGADLSKEEKATVLDLLGVSEADNYGGRTVITVTNADEHKYLDGYISSSEIGTKALSSVLIQEKPFDSTITVETHNITYCTEGMYRNALMTAGVKGAHVIVAGPYDISGTAALVGTIKAYEQISGEKVDPSAIESSVDEIITTGKLGEEIGDTDKAEAVIAYAKKELAKDPQMSEKMARKVVKTAARMYGVKLSDEQVDMIVKTLKKMQSSEIDWDNIEKQSKSIIDAFENLIKSEESQNFFQKIISWFTEIFAKTDTNN